MEEQINEKQTQLDPETSNKVPRIFAVFGEFVRRFGWLGYLLAIATIVVSLIVIFRDYKQISPTDFPGYFITISAWFWLSIGFVKFSKSYAQIMIEGNRNAILSFILLLAVFCALSGLTALYRYSVDNLVFGISAFVFAGAGFSALLLIVGLIYYWKNLVGGIHIYEE
jgi:hypothetical protein